MTDISSYKRSAALAALDFIEPGCKLGVGTGSTVNFLIAALASKRHDIAAVVASSQASATLLSAAGFKVDDLNAVGQLDLYIDGADEIDPYFNMIKGGGGALLREKIVATASDKFIAIVDASKCVAHLGKFALAVEVIPMARSLVARQLAAFASRIELRPNFVSDNGNIILDIDIGCINSPLKLEQQIKQLTGVVENGIFSARCADVLIAAGSDGVTIKTRHS